MNQQLKTSSKMKKMISRLRIPGLLMLLATLLFAQLAWAQQPQPAAPATPALPDTSKMSYNQISQQAKLYVYPAKGQNKQQQKSDEFECYKWAVEQSGIDPLNLPKVEAPTTIRPHWFGCCRGCQRCCCWRRYWFHFRRHG